MYHLVVFFRTRNKMKKSLDVSANKREAEYRWRTQLPLSMPGRRREGKGKKKGSVFVSKGVTELGELDGNERPVRGACNAIDDTRLDIFGRVLGRYNSCIISAGRVRHLDTRARRLVFASRH